MKSTPPEPQKGRAAVGEGIEELRAPVRHGYVHRLIERYVEGNHLVDFTKVVDDANNQTLKLYGDIEIPIYQRVNGNQLVSPFLSKLVLAYTF
jgi:hypothetical protein